MHCIVELRALPFTDLHCTGNCTLHNKLYNVQCTLHYEYISDAAQRKMHAELLTIAKSAMQSCRVPSNALEAILGQRGRSYCIYIVTWFGSYCRHLRA